MDDLTDTERHHYGEHRDQFVEITRPDVPARGTIVSIHGGYWRAKYGLDLHTPIVEHVASRGWNAVNVEYRRSEPGGRGAWTEMSADLLAAAHVAADLAGPHVAVGHSAGGQLALWLAAQRDHPPLDAVVALAPVADLFIADGLELSDHATAELFGAAAVDAPDLYLAASPVHLLPLGVPQLVVHGRADVDVPFALSADYVAHAEAVGDTIEFVDPDGVDHFDVIDPSHPVWRRIDAFVDSVVDPLIEAEGQLDPE